jgi:predicted esterase
MKRFSCILLLLFSTAVLLFGAEPDSSSWTYDTQKSEVENLRDLVAVLEVDLGADYWYLEWHFQSLALLLETYPPSASQALEMIEALSDPEDGGGVGAYITGARQLLIAYQSSASGKVSYARYTLPGAYENPRLPADTQFPVYAWARGGGPDYYPEDILLYVYQGQIDGGAIAGTPSSAVRNGFTIMPGALGGRAYVGNEAADFFQALDELLQRFEHKIDRSRLYLGGFSNGGKGAFLLSSQSVDKYHWAAIGLCAPAVRSQSMIDDYIGTLSEIPVWLAVGAEDGLASAARNLRDSFTALGNPPDVYYEVEGLAHEWTWDFQYDMFGFFQLQTYEFENPFEGPEAVRLTIGPTTLGGGVQLLIESPVGATVALWGSANLDDWTFVKEVSLEAGQNEIDSLPLDGASSSSSADLRFFRLAETE